MEDGGGGCGIVHALLVPVNKTSSVKMKLQLHGLLSKDKKVLKYNESLMAVPLISHKMSDLDSHVKRILRENADYCTLIEMQSTEFRPRFPVASHSQLVFRLKGLLISKGAWNDKLLSEIPSRWERHGDLVLFSEKAFKSSEWLLLGSNLWNSVCEVLHCERIARMSVIKSDDYRSPQVDLLLGENAWVTHVDNGVKYSFDVTKSMFSSGNITEKLRVANMMCDGEVIVDMYAGIGYFTLPLLKYSNGTVVHACEWNPHSLEALEKNLQLNHVQDRCIIHSGDCRQICPSGIADRVILGLLPSSASGWSTACKALKADTGGWLHIHENVNSHPSIKHSESIHQLPSELEQKGPKMKTWLVWANHAQSTVSAILQNLHSQRWNVMNNHIEHVKSYAPHIDHLVLDLECRPVKP